jgi:hypothetical protein
VSFHGGSSSHATLTAGQIVAIGRLAHWQHPRAHTTTYGQTPASHHIQTPEPSPIATTYISDLSDLSYIPYTNKQHTYLCFTFPLTLQSTILVHSSRQTVTSFLTAYINILFIDMGIPETKESLRSRGLVKIMTMNQATKKIRVLAIDVAATLFALFVADLNSIKKLYRGEGFQFEGPVNKMLQIVEKIQSLKIPLIFSFDGYTELKQTTITHRHRGPVFLERIKRKLNKLKDELKVGRIM